MQKYCLQNASILLSKYASVVTNELLSQMLRNKMLFALPKRIADFNKIERWNKIERNTFTWMFQECSLECLFNCFDSRHYVANIFLWEAICSHNLSLKNCWEIEAQWYLMADGFMFGCGRKVCLFMPGYGGLSTQVNFNSQ